jgi:hypothetical protein
MEKGGNILNTNFKVDNIVAAEEHSFNYIDGNQG